MEQLEVGPLGTNYYVHFTSCFFYKYLLRKFHSKWKSHEEKLNENMYALVLNDSYLMLANYVLATAY